MNFTRYLLCIAGFYLIQAVVLLAGFGADQLISEGGLLNWDASHYASLMIQGYDYIRTAFFPLFPLIWHLLPLNDVGISIFNGLLFIAAFAWLAAEYKIKLHLVLLIAATPVFIFFFLPYSESIFFAGSALLLLGYRKERYQWVYSGILICSLARPTATVFIPALLLTEWLARSNNRDALKKIVISSFFALAGMLSALYIQQVHTGNWFEFFKVQSEIWDNNPGIPSLPLRSWAGLFITIVDGTALLVSLVAGWVIFVWLKPHFKQLANIRLKTDKSLLFSLWYLFGMGLLVLLLRDGQLFSLNRFIFATAFFVVAAFHFTQQHFKLQELRVVMLMVIYWLLFNSYVHISTFLKYTAAALFNGLAVASFTGPKWLSRSAMIIFFAGMVVLQWYFYLRHLSEEWIG